MVVKLTALEVAKITDLGRTVVSDNLYLMIDRRHGGKSWVFRYKDLVTGKLRDKGLGKYPDVSLKDARTLTDKYRADLKKGIDPINAKREALAAQRIEQAKSITFRDCAKAYIDVHKAGWKNQKHTAQWESTLNTYASKLMDLPVNQIDKAMVLNALKGIWTTKTETASRVRQRIETVIDYAKSSGHFEGENPARWRGNLRGLLVDPSKIKEVKHQPALPYDEISAFMAELVSKGAYTQAGGLSYKALTLVILTATRASEAVNARWEEFDLDAKKWTIPKARMKAKQAHTVPLSNKALELLALLKPQANGFIFPSGLDRKGKPKPITIAAPLKVCKELKKADSEDVFTDSEGRALTIHGFRSTFRDWAGAVTAFPRELAESALAHTLKDKTEAAYMRDKLVDKRALMMDDWATYCFTAKTKASNVTPIGNAKIKK